MNPGIKRKPNLLIIIISVLVVIGIVTLILTNLGFRGKEIGLDDFYNYVETDHVKDFEIITHGGDNGALYDITGNFKSEIQIDGKYYSEFHVTFPVGLLTDVYEFATQKGFTNFLKDKSSFNIWGLLLQLLPLLLMVIFFILIIRSSRGSNNEAFSFGKSRAKLSKGEKVTFKDVAGVDEEKQELEEIIDFLKNPKVYAEMGAKIPKGILLFGAPGTGKTLLAKATAGEAGVPFFQISGSDFVEMFVGVGASRVRDMFQTAKAASPCIVFIDEIDAVGRQRGAGLGGGNDEREQTLNQLLVELDGFPTNLGVIVMAATNRPDVLDKALLRPGRFDRQITISLPDVTAREAILIVHARNKKIDPTIKWNEVAARIPGFSGADIANLLNEATLLAVRSKRNLVNVQDIDEAVDRVIMGPAKKSRKYSVKEKERVAFHEAGHAVIGLKLSGAKIVQKVTIIPRGDAGGYNLLLDKEETFVKTKEEFIANIISYLGGRAAEEIVYGTISSGAYSDISSSTAIARSMVTELGLSDLGPIQYEDRNHDVFLGRDYLENSRTISDKLAEAIDNEIHKIIFNCYEETKRIIGENRELLNTIAKYLISVETLNKSDIDEIVATGHLGWWDEKNLDPK
ncbi:MAG: ATP-dependent zinc metalloprotease FtsH [Acholeplasmatales bacterium]|jgi:cell division protease FtsH|nr:ATP-dependent zinc metalloprotease FtsH [Acholeplasmatales bacterium]